MNIQYGVPIIGKDIKVVGSSSLNKYHPFYTMNLNNREYISDDVFMYNKPKTHQFTTSARGYTKLLSILKISSQGYKFYFKYKGENHFVRLMPDFITDDDHNILLCLAYKRGSSYSLSSTSTKNYVDILNKDLRLYLSNEFALNPKYKNLYNKLYKEYILSCYRSDIEVIYCSSKDIERSLFTTEIDLKFKDIEEYNKHMKEAVSLFSAT